MSGEPTSTEPTCTDAQCGRWLIFGPPPGSGGVRADLFAHVGQGLPEGTVIVYGSGVPEGIHVSAGCWLMHVPHDWAPDDSEDDWDDLTVQVGEEAASVEV